MAKSAENPGGNPGHNGGKGNPPPEGMAEAHEQLFRVPKHGGGRLKSGGTKSPGRPRNELREMVERIGLHLAAPRLAHIIATTKDEAAANNASATILRHALPANVQVEGELVHKFIAVVPVKAKSTREWLALHAKGKA